MERLLQAALQQEQQAQQAAQQEQQQPQLQEQEQEQEEQQQKGPQELGGLADEVMEEEDAWEDVGAAQPPRAAGDLPQSQQQQAGEGVGPRQSSGLGGTTQPQ